jgi:fluoride exporter
MSSAASVAGDAMAIGFGAVLGALTRYQCGKWAASWIASDPQRFGKFTTWHTAGINIGGSFLLGGIAGTPTMSGNSTNGLLRSHWPQFSWKDGLSPRAKLMMGVGFCGSFTTFSTYSVDVVTLLSEGNASKALLYVTINNFGSFLAAAVGMSLAKAIFR